MPRAPRTGEEPRRDQLARVVEENAAGVHPARHEMERPAERIGDRLGLVVVDETREVAPARVAAQLDESGAEHDAKDQPAEQPDHGERRWPPREGTSVDERAEEDREKAGLDELDLPAVAVPVLSDVDEREIEHPQDRHQDRVCEAEEQRQRERDAEPGARDQHGIGDVEPEDARLGEERRPA